MLLTLFSSTPLNIIVTIAIILLILVLFFLERRYIKKNEDTLKKWVLVLLFVSMFVIFIGGTL
ncbi:MAG: hypothetical protein EOM74_04820, partial [Methanomicrobia archaeon]|nr:hypothetical protein [Methanomicrobia archaeon]